MWNNNAHLRPNFILLWFLLIYHWIQLAYIYFHLIYLISQYSSVTGTRHCCHYPATIACSPTLFITKGAHPFHFLPINSPDTKAEMEKKRRSIKNQFYETLYLVMRFLRQRLVCHWASPCSSFPGLSKQCWEFRDAAHHHFHAESSEDICSLTMLHFNYQVAINTLPLFSACSALLHCLQTD